MSSKVKADSVLNRYGRVRTWMPLIMRRPMGYFFYITGRCNLNCDYCWQREKEERISESTRTSRNELTGKEWINVIKSIPKLSFVGLTGGEPLLHSDFKEIIRFLSGRLSYTINTNGILLDDEMLENIIKYKVSNLSISLDGFADVHDVSRKRPGLFDLLVERIHRLNVLKGEKRFKKPSLTIKTVLLDPLVGQLDEFYRFCDEVLKADCLNISVMKTLQHAQFDFRTYDSLNEIKMVGEPACFNYKEVDRIPEALINLLKISEKRRCKVLFYPRMFDKSALDLLFRSHGRGIFGPCYIPWSTVMILANGNIIPCLSLNIANIRDMNYDVRRISGLEKYQKFLKWRNTANRTKASPPECNMCCFSAVRI